MRSFFDPRIAPYVNFVEFEMMELDLSSDNDCKSSTEMDAAQVSAMLYLAVVS